MAIQTLDAINEKVPDAKADNEKKAIDLLEHVYGNTKSESSRNSAGLLLVEKLADRPKRQDCLTC